MMKAQINDESSPKLSNDPHTKPMCLIVTQRGHKLVESKFKQGLSNT